MTELRPGDSVLPLARGAVLVVPREVREVVRRLPRVRDCRTCRWRGQAGCRSRLPCRGYFLWEGDRP